MRILWPNDKPRESKRATGEESATGAAMVPKKGSVLVPANCCVFVTGVRCVWTHKTPLLSQMTGTQTMETMVGLSEMNPGHGAEVRATAAKP